MRQNQWSGVSRLWRASRHKFGEARSEFRAAPEVRAGGQGPGARGKGPGNSTLNTQHSTLFLLLTLGYWLLAIWLLLAGCSREEPYPFPVKNDMKNKDILKTILIEALKAYETENLTKFMSLWAKQSPQYGKQKRMAQEDFNALENIRIKFKKLKIKTSAQKAALTFHQTFSADFMVPVPVQDRVRGALELRKHNGKYKVLSITLVKIKENEKLKEKPAPLSKIKPENASQREILELTKKLLESSPESNRQNFHPESPLLKNAKALEQPKGLGSLTVDVYNYSVKEKDKSATVHFTIRRSASYPVSKKVSQESNATLTCEKSGRFWRIISYKAKKIKKPQKTKSDAR